ncbi:hypothetical protein BsWGS_03337 [Bradybaena similaris]
MATATFKRRLGRKSSSTHRQIKIDKLPENVLLKIFSFLSVKDRCQSQRVCKQWKRLLCDYSVWRHVDLLEFPIGLKTLLQLVRKRFSPHMSTLKLRGNYLKGDRNKEWEPLSDAVLKMIAARCPHLQMLHLNNCNTYYFAFESLPTSIVCLEMFNCILKPKWMTDKQKHLPKLEHLNLTEEHLNSNNFGWVPVYVMEAISVWTNLKYLTTSGNLLVTDSSIKTIANNLFELEYLNISNTFIYDDAVCHIAQHLKKLRELCLADCQGVTDCSLFEIAAGLPVLNKLDISYCCQVTMRGLTALIGCSIRELIFLGLTGLSKKEKQALKLGFAVSRFQGHPASLNTFVPGMFI